MSLGFYWDEVPRCFGNPEQVMVFDKDYLHYLIKQNNGIRPCFITHNSFKLSKFGFPEEIKVSKIFAGDLDNKSKPENALLDARKMCRFAIDKNLPVAFSFSAGKGYHAYLLVEPEHYKINPNLKDAIRAVQCYMRGLGDWDSKNQEYINKLRTHDQRIIGDERRLCRVWMTKYVSGKKFKGEFIKNSNYCCPLTNEMILNCSHDEIVEYSKHPKQIKYDWSGYECLTLKDIISKYDIKKPISYMNKPENSNDGRILEFTGAADEFIMNLFPNFPCIAEAICKENPPHESRFASVCYLHMTLKWSETEILNLFRSRKWIDFKDSSTKYYIHHAITKNYNSPSCEWLRKNGMCLGISKCDDLKHKINPNYKKYNKEEWTSFLKQT